MSIRFYGYKCSKKDIWTVAEKIREFAKTKYTPDKDKSEIRRQYYTDETFKKFLDEFINTELQLFEFGDDYIFRILADGYYLENNANKWGGELVAPFHFDDRSDQTDEEIARKPEIDKIDAMIKTRRYFIIPVWDAQEYFWSGL